MHNSLLSSSFFGNLSKGKPLGTKTNDLWKSFKGRRGGGAFLVIIINITEAEFDHDQNCIKKSNIFTNKNLNSNIFSRNMQRFQTSLSETLASTFLVVC